MRPWSLERHLMLVWCGRLAQTSVSQWQTGKKIKKTAYMVLLVSLKVGLDNNCACFTSDVVPQVWRLKKTN